MIIRINEFNIVNKLSDYKTLANNPFGYVYGYYLNNMLIGFIDYSIMYEKAEINYIYIVDNYRKHGYAKELLQKFISECKDKDVRDITLEVRCDNVGAIALYQSFGFIEGPKREKYYEGIDGILMYRNLVK